MDLSDQRRAYLKGSLPDEARRADPLRTPEDWLRAAREDGEPEGTAMALATVDPGGAPAVRYVLCKGVTDRGVRFFTNRASRKGIALAADDRAAATFWWAGAERSVRIVGRCRPLPQDEVDAYFASRPRGSRLGAWASQQSRPVADRSVLEAQAAKVEARFDDPEPVGAPPEWGGYELVAAEIELWQGRDDRLHDRIHFVRPSGDAAWTAERLQP